VKHESPETQALEVLHIACIDQEVSRTRQCGLCPVEPQEMMLLLLVVRDAPHQHLADQQLGHAWGGVRLIARRPLGIEKPAAVDHAIQVELAVLEVLPLFVVDPREEDQRRRRELL